MAVSRPFEEDHLALPLSTPLPPGDRWCDALGFVPAGSVSSFSTLQIFRVASRLWGLLFPPVYLFGPNTKRFKRTLIYFNKTHSMHIFKEIPFIKPQHDT